MGVVMFKRIFSREQKEEAVLEEIQRHLNILVQSCEMVEKLLSTGDKDIIETVKNLERQADVVRRAIFSKLFEGAFIPYLRPHIYRFVEIVDEAIDEAEDAARYCEFIDIPNILFDHVLEVARMNAKMAELLSITFQAFREGDDLRERVLAIRIYEKRIDDLDHLIKENARGVTIDNFWYGCWLSEFLRALTMVSDYLEDAADVLSIVRMSLS